MEIWKPVRILSSKSLAEREEDGVGCKGVEVPLPAGGEEMPLDVPISLGGKLRLV